MTRLISIQLAGLLFATWCSPALAVERADNKAVTESVALDVPVAKRATVVSQQLSSSQTDRIPFHATLDIYLDSDRAIHGRVVDRQGRPRPHVVIQLSNHRGVVGSVTSDAKGRFVAQTGSGMLTLQVDDAKQFVRIWDAELAPPNAQSEIMLGTGQTLRAQAQACAGPNCQGCNTCGGGVAGAGYTGHFGGIFQRALQNPWLIGAGTAAALTIPLVTDDDDDNSARGGDGEPAS